MTEVRGLQLAWTDKATASGLMTEARQTRSPAAGAPSGAYAKHGTLATLSASNAGLFGWEGAVQTVCSVRRQRAYARVHYALPKRQRRLPPCRTQGPPTRREVKSWPGHSGAVDKEHDIMPRTLGSL